MGTGYTRNDTGNNIADGNVINAADFDGEYDAIEAAFNSSSGHTHDGTSAEGAPIEVLGPSQDVVITASVLRPKTNNTVDLGTTSLKFKDAHFEGTVNVDGGLTPNQISVKSTDAGNSKGPQLDIFRESASPADNDALGHIDFSGEDDGDNKTIYASILATANDVTDGTEDGSLKFNTMVAGSDTTTMIVESGNVGIGASPTTAYKLFVKGTDSSDSGDVTVRLETGTVSSNSATNDLILDLTARSKTSGGSALAHNTEIRSLADASGNGGILAFYTDNSSSAITERMRINSSGSVLIANTSTSGISANADDIVIGDRTDSAESGITFGSTVASSLRFADAGATSQGIIQYVQDDSSNTDYMNFYTNATERVRILSTGDVGIGTGGNFSVNDITGSGFGLVIGSSSASSAGIQIRTGTSGAGNIYFGDNSGSDAGRFDGFIQYSQNTRQFNIGVAQTQIMTIDKANENTLKLVSVETDAARGPVINLSRDNSDSADGDQIGAIVFNADDDANNQTEFASITGFIQDASNTTEDGGLIFDTASAGNPSIEKLRLSGNEAVFNNDSADVDFRVESNGNTHMLFVDGGNDGVGISCSDTSIASTSADDLVIGNGSAGSVGLSILSGTGANNSIFFGDGESGDDRFRGFVQYRHSVDDLLIGAVGQTQLSFANTEVVFNEDSYDRDFRIEGNGEGSLFFVDASKDRIGIGTAGLANDASGNGDNHGILMVRDNTYPVASFQRNAISNTTGNFTCLVLNTETTGTPAAGLGSGMRYLVDGSIIAETAGFNNGTYEIKTCAAGASLVPKLHIGTTTTVFNEDSADIDFRVESNANSHMIFVDGNNDKVGINTSAPEAVLHAQENGSSSKKGLQVSNYNTTAGTAQAINVDFGLARNSGPQKAEAGRIKVGRDNDWTSDDSKIDSYMSFSHYKNNALNEAMRITGSSDVLFNESTGGAITNGQGAYIGSNGQLYASTSSSSGHFFNVNNDGQAVLNFRHAGSTEGNVTISGSTVSYNGFSGRHESSGIPTNTPIGTVVSTIDALDVYPDTTHDQHGNVVPHGKAGQTRADHPKVEVSSSEGDSCVYGIVSEFDDDGKLIVTSVGIGSIRVTGSCAKGDLLESNGDGTAKVQSDDIIRSKTIGKVTIANSDTGVKLVSCVMYCG